MNASTRKLLQRAAQIRLLSACAATEAIHAALAESDTLSVAPANRRLASQLLASASANLTRVWAQN